MVSWFAGEDREFLGHRRNCDFPPILAAVDPRLGGIGVPLKLLPPVILNPLAILWPNGQSDLIHGCLLIDLFFSQSQQFLLSFHLRSVVSEVHPRIVLLIYEVIHLLLGFSCLTVLGYVFNGGEVVEAFDRTSVVFVDELLSFGGGVALLDDGLQQLLVDIPHSMLTQLLLDLLLLLPETSEISSPQLPREPSQMRLIQPSPRQRILNPLEISLRQQRQQLSDLLTGEFIVDDLRREYLREIGLKQPAGQLCGLLLIEQREGGTIEDVLIVCLYGMRVGVGEGISKEVDLVLKGLLDVGVDAGSVIVVVGPVE